MSTPESPMQELEVTQIELRVYCACGSVAIRLGEEAGSDRAARPQIGEVQKDVRHELDFPPLQEAEKRMSNPVAEGAARKAPRYSSLREWIELAGLFAGARRRKRDLLSRGVSEETLEQFSITGQAMLKSRLDHGKAVANVIGVHQLGGTGRGV